MRGAYDFETWEWTNPLCCGLAWGERGQIQTAFIKDTSHIRPEAVAPATLLRMADIAKEQSVYEWWAHNGGKYDVLFMLDAVTRLGWEATALIAGGSRCIELSIKAPGLKKRLLLRDSYAVAQSSLKTCAEDFELPSRKLFNADDYSKDVRTWEPNRLREGCLTDCILVLELLDKVETLLTEWGGSLRTTFSASSLTVVKASLAEKGIALPVIPSSANRSARSAFYGARVEVFTHRPHSELTEFDVTSSYPWAMTQSLPWEFEGDASPAGLEALMCGDREGTITARVTVPECEFPPLPYRVKSGGIYFPTGTWEGHFPACELRYAIVQGVRVEPLEGLVYSKSSPFGEYVHSLFSLKAASTGAVRSFAKLCLNGCFGKWAQAPEREELLLMESEEAALQTIATATPGTIGRLGADRRFLTRKIFRWPKHTHYALAGYVTGYARILLHKALLASREPAYCDSDSVHCAHGTRLRGMEGKGLGELKVELLRYRGEFFAPKMYRLKEPGGKIHLAAKGFPVEEKAFARMVALEGVTRERMQAFKSQAKGAKGGRTFVKRLTETKTWSGRSMKRALLPGQEGKTRAWTVRELESKAFESSLSPFAREIVALEDLGA